MHELEPVHWLLLGAVMLMLAFAAGSELCSG